MPPRRDDGSIFLSLATYRDENCINTIKWAYEKAKNPEKLFVGLVQQNCHKDCMSGILEGGKTEPVPPDDDCYKTFCEGEGKKYCDRGQVRVLNIDEPESLGPYAARYFASKLWSGEQWFMQTDAHMTFAHGWDATSVEMLKRCPSKKRTCLFVTVAVLVFIMCVACCISVFCQGR
jgi:[Skp1-protein]-hydroxyproline N-acetylglucosaminyltransferase